jgi:dihydroxyacetone kinase-like protein
VPLASAKDAAAMLVEPVLAEIQPDEGVLAFVNGLGATPLIEQYLIYGEVAALLGRHGVRVVRSLVGPYITSLDMAGVSVTLLALDEELLRLWDAPVDTPGLRWGA